MKLTEEQFFILKEKIKGSHKVQIMSGSMEPYIYTDEDILIHKTKPNKIKRYTPIVFWHNDLLVCHFFKKRIIKDGITYFQTKGLSSKDDDPLVDERFVLGEVVIPKIGFFRRMILRFAL
jgi:hypothetical protein